MGVYTLKIAGVSFHQKEIKLCREGERLILKREPENKYDSDAVAVLRENGKLIGYISRDDAEWVSRIMDEGKQVEAKIKWINGGTRGKPTYGVIIDLNTTPEAGWEDSKEQLEQKEKKAHKGFWRWIFGG
jgi:hypothetical protein